MSSFLSIEEFFEFHQIDHINNYLGDGFVVQISG